MSTENTERLYEAAEETQRWPSADVIFVDRACIVGMETFEPGVYLLAYDPSEGHRDYVRAGTQLGQDPDLGDKILEGIDEVISWIEVDAGVLYDLFSEALESIRAGEGTPS